MIKTTIKNALLVFAFTVVSVAAKAAPLNKSAAAPQAEKEWTFLLFLNGHNNLSSYGDMNIKDMEKSGSNDKVNFVVEWGKADDQMTHRLLVKKSTDPTKVTSPIIMSQKNVDMGDYKTLVEFAKWGIENYPAKHYFVAVWNHGSGWHFQDMMRSASTGDFHTTDISYDDNTGHHITTEQLGLAMNQIKSIIGHNVDVYGSDACLMQMVEVAAQMKGSVDYFVGSQETEPGEGWPYETFFKKWTSAASMSPADVSVLLSKEYLAAYNGGVYGHKEVTFGALDMSKLDALLASTADLSAHLKSLPAASVKQVKTAANATQDFYYSDYKDYGDFLKRLTALPIQKDAKLIARVQSDLKSAIIATNNSSGSFANATGLSIWFPSYSSSDMDRYLALDFNKATAWGDFLKAASSAQ